MDKHQNKINRISIVSGIATIITVVIFFAKGYGTMAIAQYDIQQLKDGHKEQLVINKDVFGAITKISTTLESMEKLLSKLDK